MYLPDTVLQEYLQLLTVEAISRGDVSGLLLTGCGPNACPMFQQYIDNCNDLQSVVLLACSIGITDHHQLIGDQNNNGSGCRSSKKIQEWIHLYRDLLNRLQLWLIRAKFDVARAKQMKRLKKRIKKERHRHQKINDSNDVASSSSIGSTAQTALSLPEQKAINFIQRPQVAARCNHCKASFQLNDLLADASIKRSDWLAKQPAKMLSCPLPKCKKALPRCSICLLPMTVQNPFLYLGQKRNNKEEEEGEEEGEEEEKEDAGGMGEENAAEAQGGSHSKGSNTYSKRRNGKKKVGVSWEGTNPYSEWFVWCNSCHHGGHTQCLSDWFRRHPKCPVSNCNCVCSTLDTFL